MVNVHDIPELDRRGLARFGFTTGVAAVVVFGLFFPWMLERDWPVWPWVVAAVLWALALLRPSLLRGVYRAWMRFGLLASRVMTPLVLGSVFFVMITPIALILRVMGKDAMHRAFEPQRKSYRVPSSKRPEDRLDRPF